jgi:Lon protease-like protein
MARRAAAFQPSSVERRDYLQRLIEQIADAVARIMRLKTEQPAEAVREADGALARLTGLPLSMLLKLGPSGVASLLGAEKTKAALPLLEATAQALEASSRNDEATKVRLLVASLRGRTAG